MGSRFLPATKASPKEMMPIVDKPLIQYAVEEAELAARGKTDLLALIQDVIPKSVNCIYIRQAEPLGLGHAVLCAQAAVNDEVFAVILADDLIDGKPPVVRQMTELFERHQSPMVAVQQVKREH